MILVNSVNGVPIRLTRERWHHVVHRHPELAEERDKVLETVAEPDMIQEGDYGELLAIRFFPQLRPTGRHLVAVYREVGFDDGFILTAYLTDQPSSERFLLWTR